MNTIPAKNHPATDPRTRALISAGVGLNYARIFADTSGMSCQTQNTSLSGWKAFLHIFGYSRYVQNLVVNLDLGIFIRFAVRSLKKECQFC